MICVKHSIITTLTTGAYVGFLRGRGPSLRLVRGVAKRLLGRFEGMLPREFFLNYATCVLEHIFINFLLEKIKNYFFYTKIMINCSHVLAIGFRSMIH